MPVRKKQFARARLGAVCVAASVIAGAITAPSAWSVATDEIEIVPRSDAPVTPTEPEDGETNEDVVTPAPGESGTPSPEPTPEPSPTDAQPTPSPSSSPSPSQPTSEPSPPAPVPPAPAPVPPRVEGEAGIELRAPTAVRLGALLRLTPRNAVPASPTPEPSDVVHVDGGPDVGGSAQLGASVPAEDPTGRTDAVRVGSLHDGSGAELAQPAVWAPWGGALAVAGAAVAVLVLRGGRQIGR